MHVHHCAAKHSATHALFLVLGDCSARARTVHSVCICWRWVLMLLAWLQNAFGQALSLGKKKAVVKTCCPLARAHLGACACLEFIA